MRLSSMLCFAPQKNLLMGTLPHPIPVNGCWHLMTFLWWDETCPVASGLLHVTLCEERASVLSVAVFSTVLEYCDHFLTWYLFSREKRSNTFNLSSQGRSSSPLVIFKVILRRPSGFSTSLLNYWDQKQTQYSGCSLKSAEYSRMIVTLALVVMLLQIQ